MPLDRDPPEPFYQKMARELWGRLKEDLKEGIRGNVIAAAGVYFMQDAVGWAMQWVADHKPLIDELRAGIAHTVGTYLGKLIAVAVLCGSGYGLAALKRRQPIVYGNLEIALAVLAIWITLGQGADYTSADAAKLASGVYFIVRGLTNRREGIERRDQARGLATAGR